MRMSRSSSRSASDLGARLEADLQALDGLREEAGVPEGLGVGEDARHLRLGARRGGRLEHLLDDLDARLDEDLAVGLAGGGDACSVRGRTAGAEAPTGKLGRRVFDLAVADVDRVDVVVRRSAAAGAGAGRDRSVRLGGGRRRRAGGAGGDRDRGELLHPLVVGRELLQLGEEIPEEVLVAAVARDARHLLLDFDGLRRLPDHVEGAREQAERVEVALVGLEADLQLRQGEHAVVGAAAREQQLGGRPRVRGVGLLHEQAVEDLEGVVAAPELGEQARGGAELGDRAVDVLRPQQRLGQAQVGQRVRRVELDDLAEDVERLAVAALLLQTRRDLVEGLQGVARQPERLVKLGELRRDVGVLVLELRDVLPDDLADLLEDGDRLQREALARVELADPLVGDDGVGVRLHLRLQIADLQEDPGVVRILLDDPLILRDRPVVPLLLDVLLGGCEDLLAVNRHDSECSSNWLGVSRRGTVLGR